MSAQNIASGLDNSYTYDSDGLRLTKTVGDVQHKYVWQGSQLVSENWAGQELEFFYDESGSPYAFSYKASATATPVMYYYVTNLQGDVVNILDASGNIKASYTYNAWGDILSATGDMADINPLRYRGYYFDSDTGLYYLKSRYYDPQLCRFINSDEYASTGQGILGSNMFAYCLNNPVVYFDDLGSIAITLSLVAIGKLLFDGCVTVLTICATVKAAKGIAELTTDLWQNCSPKAKSLILYTTTLALPISQRETIAEQISASFALSTPRTYRTNEEWHHIVAKAAPNAGQAQAVLASVGIGLNSIENLVYIKTGLHRRLHTNVYYGFTNSVVISAYRAGGNNPIQQKDNVILSLRGLKTFLLSLDQFAPY